MSYRYGGDLWRDERIGGVTCEYAYNAKKRLVAVSADAVLAGAAWPADDTVP